MMPPIIIANPYLDKGVPFSILRSEIITAADIKISNKEMAKAVPKFTSNP